MKNSLLEQEKAGGLNGTFPLSDVNKGQKVRLVTIDAGKKLMHRLHELGLTPGVELMLVHDSGGPLLLSVRDSRVAIGRGMAAKLRVEDVVQR